MQIQTVAVRNVALFIILVLLVFIIYPVLLQIGRPWLYEFAHRAADLVLDYQTGDYLTGESEHFRLKYSEADQSTAPFVLSAAEKYYADVEALLNCRPVRGNKLTIVVYPDAAALNKAFGWNGDKSADGVYWAGSIRLLSPLASLPPADPEQYFLRQGPLAHELTHYLTDVKTKGNYTRWLSEGLAQYAEKEITGFALAVPSPAARQSLYPLTSLDKKFDAQPDQTLAYWESLQAVAYLIQHDGMEKMQDFLVVLGQGEGLSRALAEIYGMSLDELDRTYPRAASFLV